MMKAVTISKAVTLSLLLTTALGCGDDDPGRPPTQHGSIADLAQETPELSTLVAAVQFASDDGDLLALLDSPGELTLFAPTNTAFDALAAELTGDPGAQGGDLLIEAYRPLVRSVLQYHVLTTEVRAAEIPFGMPIETAEGSIFKIEEGTPPVIVDGRNREARITRTDLVADNGVVHVMDRVILPPDLDLVELAQSPDRSTAELSILIEAIGAADLEGALSGEGPLTVFAPTDDAFAALLAELGITKQQLLANRPLLTRVLTYHVVDRRLLEAQIPVETPIETAQGETFRVDADLEITDARGRTAKIIATDRFATNGVLHVIDRVMLPSP